MRERRDRPHRGERRAGRPERELRAPARSFEPARAGEEVVYGRRAGLAVLARRPAAVLRVACAPGLRREIEDAFRRAGPNAARVACAEMDDASLGRSAGSDHHEGLCVVTKPRAFASLRDLGDRLLRTKGVAVAFDRVRNPYNIGAILRTAAFFGAEGAILGAPAPHPALPPDAVRVAEGGAEDLCLARTTDLADSLGRLRALGVRVFGAENDASINAIGHDFPRPAILVVGHEREGMGDRVIAQCDAMVRISGHGVVGSLNVGIAASVLLAEMLRPQLKSP